MPLLGSRGAASTTGFGALANLGYFLRNSLRFRASNSAYLSRTPSSAGNRRTWTWSGWVKRGIVDGDYRALFQAGTDTPWFGLLYSNSGSDNKIQVSFTSGVSPGTATTAEYRDPASWYHIVLAVDTTQASSSDRIKLYVNGEQITSFSNSNPPSQNFDTQVNSTQRHTIGNNSKDLSSYFDGYMAEINFVDGQALTPSSFGKTDAVTNQWIPKKYSGAYGTNGFYLPFTNTTSTSTLGNDFSGNGNTWTVNNISLTAGATYDSMTDVPTLTNATTANYCVMNQLNKNSNHTLSNGNLTITSSSFGAAAATFGVSSGKWYHEATISNRTTNNSGSIGFCNENYNVPVEQYFPNTTDGFGVNAIDGRADSGGAVSYGSGFNSGDVIMIAFDADAKKMWVGKNGTWFASGDPVAGTNQYPKTITGSTFFPCVNCYGDTYQYNFGQRPFAYTPPTGFKAFNSFNLS